MFSNQLTIGWERTLRNPVRGVHLDADIQAAGTQPHASCSAPASPRRGSCTGRGVARDDRAHHAACGRRSPLPALHPGRSRMLMGRLRAPPLAAFAPCCSTTPQPPRPLAASVPCCSTPPQPLRPWGHRAFAAQGRRTPSCSTARGCCSSAARVAAAICDLDPGGVGRRGDDETRM